MDAPFDRRLRRLRRERAARSRNSADYLLHRAGEELIERLDLVTRRFGSALVIGSAGAEFDAALERRVNGRVLADPSLLRASAGGGVQCEEDRLPFADHSFDLVLSVGLLDSVNDLPGALTLIRRVLSPDGLFLAALSGAGSLPRLRAAMAAGDEAMGNGAAPRIHPQIDVRAAGDLLMRAGFVLPVVDTDSVTVRFPDLRSLVDDLRAMGATNLLTSRSRQPIGRTGLAAALAHFATSADPDGRTGERFDLLYLSGWSPGPDQPRPARRGSATHSLTDALRKRP